MKQSLVKNSITISLLLLLLLSCGERDKQRGDRDQCKEELHNLYLVYGYCLEDPPTEGCDRYLGALLYQDHQCTGMKVNAPL